MKNHLRAFALSVLLVMALCTTSSAWEQRLTSISFEGFPSVTGKIAEDCEPLADLYLQLMTRPGITNSSDIGALQSAAQEAALIFRQSVFHGPGSIVKWVRFRKDVGLLVSAYQNEYALAPDTAAKGAALDHLFDGLLQASIRNGISFEEFDAALLRGAATVEAMISERPLSKKLSLTGRELAIYLLRVSIHQDRRRTLLDSTRSALEQIHAAEEFTTHYDSRIYTILKPTLAIELVGLENSLADPLFVNDLQNIIAYEYNNEATCDLFAIKFMFELSFLSSSLQESLLSSFAARIPGMTPEILQEQLGQISITAFAAFFSANPNRHLAYFPVSGLADRLAVLGETPPTPPDFSLFPEPYRALIRMQYDIRLCDMITAQEWNRANNAIQDLTRPLSLGEQLLLKEAAMKRLAQVRAHLRGVSEKTAGALLILLESGLRMRI